MNSDSILNRRAVGVVLHVTSLPGPHGCGDLGETAFRFVDWLASAGCKLWQMLPVNPIGPGNSPYQSPSAFAGNALFVALPPLVQAGWLAAPRSTESLAAPDFDALRVDYDATIPWRWAQLRAAATGFYTRASLQDRLAFQRWRESQAGWLADWSLYAALKDAHAGLPWWCWAPALARREAAALASARSVHAQAVAMHEFVQWCFDTQMAALRSHARQQGVALMGDLPIFVAHDSADVWARPDLYWMGVDHQPLFVAGTPPDGYSAEGQRWGNPLYRWDRMADEGFAWWSSRLRRAQAHADVFRIDHFRGFAGYWEIPASCPTAAQGRWAPAPGMALFSAIETAFQGEAPLNIVAEDLGHITPDVTALRDHFGFPGMRIVHEAFQGDASHPFLPHHHVRNGLVYSSTHDSDTAVGWWAGAGAAQRAFAADYLQGDLLPAGEGDIAWALICAACRSVANLALFPLQDILSLGGAHRMNRPGSAEGNWRWRFEWSWLGADIAPRLARLAQVTGRA